MEEKIKICIIDDHQLVVEGLVSMLEKQNNIEIIATANNGKEAIKKIEILNPDLILMDLDMPEMNGFQTTEYLKKNIPNLKIIILSMHQEKVLVEKLIRMGIDAYLIKNSDKRDFIECIEKVSSGKQFFSAEITRSLVFDANHQAKFNQNNTLLLLSQLTEREKEILILIADGNTNPEIAKLLFISPRTVDTHRKNLLKKLEVKNTAGLVRFALKSGLVV